MPHNNVGGNWRVQHGSSVTYKGQHKVHYINIDSIHIDTESKLAVQKGGLAGGIECSDCCWKKAVFKAGCFGGYGHVAPARGEEPEEVMGWM